MLVPDIKVDTIAQGFLNMQVSCYGCPLIVATNCSLQFQCALCTALTQLLGTDVHTAAYHLVVEWLHCQLKATLTAQDDRDH